MQQFICPPYDDMPDEGVVTWRAPSNIALIKYWGKKDVQLPQNPSLSFCLKNCHTTTTLHFKKSAQPDLSVYVDGTLAQEFKPKIEQFLSRCAPYLPWIGEYDFKIETSNSFPHSSGIASSASGFAALALCLLNIYQNENKTDFQKKASFLARLGSGSACRSIHGDWVVWGDDHGEMDSSDFFGIPYPHKIDPIFQTYCDTVLLIDQGQKKVSSSVGHGLMKNHPFAAARFAQAREHMAQMQDILAGGDVMAFCHLAESEALSLHAMMMTSAQNFMLMKPNTLAVMEKIQTYREKHDLPVCFTLDAGANVHCLYPKQYQKEVMRFIEKDVVAYCDQGAYIADEMGTGAVKVA